jgi:site-specific recombinase XerD
MYPGRAGRSCTSITLALLQLDALAEGYHDRDLVFATRTGRPNSERDALRSLKRAAKHADVTTEVSPHDFRRLAARLLVASGVDIATAAAILGHKRASVLLNVYARALRAPKRVAAERLQAAL